MSREAARESRSGSRHQLADPVPRPRSVPPVVQAMAGTPLGRLAAVAGASRDAPAGAPRALSDLAALARAQPSPAGRAPLQAKAQPNRTGLPDGLKAAVEARSGLAMDDVRVHYNSRRPAALQAHAYAQGAAIHLAPGQEKHLPHEAWHVVQQKQGRVRPTVHVGGVGVNDDRGLEREADLFGSRMPVTPRTPGPAAAHASFGVVQRFTIDGAEIALDDFLRLLQDIASRDSAKKFDRQKAKDLFYKVKKTQDAAAFTRADVESDPAVHAALDPAKGRGGTRLVRRASFSIDVPAHGGAPATSVTVTGAHVIKALAARNKSAKDAAFEGDEDRWKKNSVSASISVNYVDAGGTARQIEKEVLSTWFSGAEQVNYDASGKAVGTHSSKDRVTRFVTNTRVRQIEKKENKRFTAYSHLHSETAFCTDPALTDKFNAAFRTMVRAVGGGRIVCFTLNVHSSANSICVSMCRDALLHAFETFKAAGRGMTGLSQTRDTPYVLRISSERIHLLPKHTALDAFDDASRKSDYARQPVQPIDPSQEPVLEVNPWAVHASGLGPAKKDTTTRVVKAVPAAPRVLPDRMREERSVTGSTSGSMETDSGRLKRKTREEEDSEGSTGTEPVETKKPRVAVATVAAPTVSVTPRPRSEPIAARNGRLLRSKAEARRREGGSRD